jgi:hypothetical protein
MKPTALIGVWAVGLAVVLGIPDGIWRTCEHVVFLSVVTIGALANATAAGVVEKVATHRTFMPNGSGGSPEMR